MQPPKAIENAGSRLQPNYAMRTCLLPLCLLLSACGGGPDVNIFSVNRDAEWGKEIFMDIYSSPAEFPIIGESDDPRAYAYLQGMVDEIVAAGGVPHQDVFPYKVTILDQDVQNAFATAGGYIYVYTGLIKFLETEDELAGVLAHEIAHAAERHVTEQATKRYGLNTLVALFTGEGNGGILADIGENLIGLGFSRAAEAEADARSVDYLCGTRFAADGAAGFFRKSEGAPTPLQFLSTHPSPENRVEKIKERAAAAECPASTSSTKAFRQFQRRF